VADQRSTHWAGRTRDRFDEALLRLREAGTFAAVEWPNGFTLGDSDRAKGWVAGWLSSKVTIYLSASSAADEAAPSRTEAHRQHPRRTKSAGIDPSSIESLRLLRSKRGVSQLELARELGISASYLSQIEHGKKPATGPLRDRISVWAVHGDGEPN